MGRRGLGLGLWVGLWVGDLAGDGATAVVVISCYIYFKLETLALMDGISIVIFERQFDRLF